EEGLDRGEELPESGAGPKALLMALDRVPLDAHHEPLGFFDAPAHLVSQAVRVGVEHVGRLPVGLLKLCRSILGDDVADVLDHHRLTLRSQARPGRATLAPNRYGTVLYCKCGSASRSLGSSAGGLEIRASTTGCSPPPPGSWPPTAT